MLTVLIVDDEPLARENLRVLLEQEEDIAIVGECANAVEAIGAVHRLRPDVLFLDIQMPRISGRRWRACWMWSSVSISCFSPPSMSMRCARSRSTPSTTC